MSYLNAPVLSQRRIISALFRLAIPIILANMLETSYQLVNTFWVGRLGAGAVAAVSASFPIVFLLFSLAGGVAIAGSILVAQYTGARDSTQVNHVAAQTILLAALVSVLITPIGYLLTPQLLKLMNIDATIHQNTTVYMRISFLSLIFVFLFATFQSLMTSTGEVRTPLYLVAFSVILNLLLDPLLIFGWGPVPALGVAGAAWATLIAHALTAAVSMHRLFTGRTSVCLQIHDFYPDGRLIRRVIVLGLPASVEQSIQALGTTVMTAIVASFGTLTLAAYGLGFRIFIFVMIPAFGLSSAAAILVGQSMGAGDTQRAEEIAVLTTWCAATVLTIAGALLFLTAVPVVHFFVPSDAALTAMGARTIQFMSLAFGFYGARVGLSGALRSAGDTVATMSLVITSVWLVQIPMAWLLSMHTVLNTDGLWLSYPLSAAITALAIRARFKTGNWKRIKLTNTITSIGNLSATIAADQQAP